MDAFQLAPGNLEVASGGGSRGKDEGLKPFGQRFRVNVPAIDEDDAFLFEQGDAAVDDALVQLEVRNAIAQQTARLLAGLKDRDAVAAAVQRIGSGQSCRTGSDDSHPATIALDRTRADEIFREGVFGNRHFVFTVRGRFVLRQIEDAGFLAECRTDAPRKFRKRVGGGKQAVGHLPIATIEGIVPLGRLIAQGAGPMAEGHAAVHAARSLLAAVADVERLLHFAEIVDSIVDGTVACLLAGHREECFWISHNRFYVVFVLCVVRTA